jgi:hypothetical protein
MGYLDYVWLTFVWDILDTEKKSLKSSMLISSLHNDDLLICMPQNNNNNKITNTFKKRYTYLSFVDCELKKTYHT